MALAHSELTHRVLASAYTVHARLGPGLLESVYRICLAREFEINAISAECEVPIAIEYRGRRMDTGFRADIIVERKVLVELKACERLLPIHEAQVLTYLRLSRLEAGLLINFNVVSLKNGLRRIVNQGCAGARE